MKRLFFFLPLLLIVACSSPEVKKDAVKKTKQLGTLTRVSNGTYELGHSFAYVNQKGDTIVPFGKYELSYSESIHDFGFVKEKGTDGKLLAINGNGEVLYQVYWMDNGPDEPQDGLFRIMKEEWIGYANATTGKVVIEPQYACAWPFENGKAKVSKICSEFSDGEHTEWRSNEWIFIDKEGKVVK